MGFAGAAVSGEFVPGAGWTAGWRIAASGTGLWERGFALVGTVVVFHQAEMAEYADWQVEVAHSAPAGILVSEGVVFLADGSRALVGIGRAMSYARLVAELERYDAYRNAPPAGCGSAARGPRSRWQGSCAGPSLGRPPAGAVGLRPGRAPRGPGSGGGRLP
ncbi:hypothetical protein [Streptomyces sp. NPDC000877]|uniref:hypothetical protein n=1 Tax=unclassified Streptomyces TaxID=2593676 RepID=UPI00331D4721